MAPGFQQVAKLLVVVDLAVEDDPHGSVFVRNRLVAVVQIDDAQTPHAQGNAVAEVNAFVVWSAVDHGAAHPADFVFEDWTPVPPNDSGYATHRRILSITTDWGQGSGIGEAESQSPRPRHKGSENCGF